MVDGNLNNLNITNIVHRETTETKNKNTKWEWEWDEVKMNSVNRSWFLVTIQVEQINVNLFLDNTVQMK